MNTETISAQPETELKVPVAGKRYLVKCEQYRCIAIFRDGRWHAAWDDRVIDNVSTFESL